MSQLIKAGLQKKTFACTWSIENFFSGCANIGDYYTSPDFPINEYGQHRFWKLRIYPNGEEEYSQDFVSLYLRYESDDIADATVGCELSIVNEQCTLRKQIKAKHFKAPLDIWGSAQFAKQDFIKDKNTRALINDTLTITCKITFDPNAIIFVGYNKWLDTMQKGFQEFETLIDNSCFGDVTFNVKGKKICLHKDILMCRSSFFKAMFEHDTKEKKERSVDIPDIDYEVMKELFRFIYSDKVENIENIAKNLLIAADKYKVTKLKALCEKTLCDNLTADNAIEYLKLIQRCNTLYLKKLVIEFVADNLKEVVEVADFNLLFADLDCEVVCEIMKAVGKKN